MIFSKSNYRTEAKTGIEIYVSTSHRTSMPLHVTSHLRKKMLLLSDAKPGSCGSYS